MKSTERQYFIDNLRTVLTIMVVLVHLSITYGGEGGWYFQEATDKLGAIIPLTLFNAVNQSFFMSLFFFLAAYFSAGAFERKSSLRFGLERVKRLGAPLLIFIFGIGPLTILLTGKLLDGEQFIYSQSTHVGPMWFVQALLIFSGVYIIYRLLRKPSKLNSSTRRMPGAAYITTAIAVMAVLTVVARAVWPMGDGIAGMQLGSFPQYIMMFGFGIAAYQRKWLDSLSRVPIKALGIAVSALTVLLPIVMFLGVHPELGFELFMGGMSWQAVFYGVRESVMCVLMSLLVLGLFRKRFNGAGRLAKIGAKSAFTVYIIHPPVLILCAALFSTLAIAPLLKFVIVGVFGIAIAFFLAHWIRQLPLLRNVL